MHKMVIDNTEITTNYGEEGMYSMHSGEPGKTQRVFTMDNHETTEQFVARMVGYGFTKIRLAQTSTNVTGWHRTIALCRR